MKQPLFLLILVSFLALSCQKDVDIEPPKMTIISPIDKQAFKNGQSVVIKSDISDNDAVHFVAVVVTNTKTSATIHQKSEYLHESRYTFTSTFIINEVAPTTYKVEVIASDHDGNEQTNAVFLTIN